MPGDIFTYSIELIKLVNTQSGQQISDPSIILLTNVAYTGLILVGPEKKLCDVEVKLHNVQHYKIGAELTNATIALSRNFEGWISDLKYDRFYMIRNSKCALSTSLV